MPESVSGWMRANLGLAVTLMALVGTVAGGIVAATAWLSSVHHLERRVDVLRAEVNVIRATMDANRKDRRRHPAATRRHRRVAQGGTRPR